MSLKSKFKTARSVLQKEGASAFLQKAYGYCLNAAFAQFLRLPICFIKARSAKSKELNDLIDFAFRGCRGYFAPWQVKSEISSLLNFVASEKPKTLMEIGTARGGTLMLFAKALPEDSLIISLDLPAGDFGGGYPFWKIFLYKSFAHGRQAIRLVRKDSHSIETRERIKNMLNNRPIDFLFIDGDHTYEGVKKDFELYNPLVRKGGIIAFHDVAPHNKPGSRVEISKFWNEIKNKYDYKEFVENWGQNWAGIGLIRFKG